MFEKMEDKQPIFKNISFDRKIISIKYNRIMMLIMLFNCNSNINAFSQTQ